MSRILQNGKRCWNRAGMWCTAVLTAAGIFQGSIVSAGDEQKRLVDELNGTWKLVTVERSEETEPLKQYVQWVVKGRQVLYGGEPLGTLTYDASTVPKVVDLSLDDTKVTYEGLYVLKNYVLKICLNVKAGGAKERPIDFSVQDKSSLRLLTFERVADDAVEPPAGYVGIGLDLGEPTPKIAVNSLVKGGPAERAGLRIGDVLLSISDADVADGPMLVTTIRSAAPGTQLTFRVQRDGVEKRIPVKVAYFPFSLLQLFE